MNKVIFTKEFYISLYEAMYEYCKENFEGESEMAVFVDEIENNGQFYEVDCSVDIYREWCDDSFDHAFGTWVDYDAHYEFTDIEGIANVIVRDENGNEVEGFSIDDYHKYTEQDEEHEGICKGDKVMIKGRQSKPVAEVLHYDHHSGEYCVKTDKNKYYIGKNRIKKISGVWVR